MLPSYIPSSPGLRISDYLTPRGETQLTGYSSYRPSRYAFRDSGYIGGPVGPRGVLLSPVSCTVDLVGVVVVVVRSVDPTGLGIHPTLRIRGHQLLEVLTRLGFGIDGFTVRISGAMFGADSKTRLNEAAVQSS